MIATTQYPQHAVYNRQGAKRQNNRDNATVEDSLLGTKRHMGQMGDVVII